MALFREPFLAGFSAKISKPPPFCPIFEIHGGAEEHLHLAAMAAPGDRLRCLALRLCQRRAPSFDAFGAVFGFSRFSGYSAVFGILRGFRFLAVFGLFDTSVIVVVFVFFGAGERVWEASPYLSISQAEHET